MNVAIVVASLLPVAGGTVRAQEAGEVAREPIFVAEMAGDAFHTGMLGASHEAIAHYRLDAQVRLPLLAFSIALFTRSEVGAATIAYRELNGAEGLPLRTVEAVSTTFPDRARGLDWTVFFREAFRLDEDGDPASSYFGVVSEPGEKTRQQVEGDFEEAGPAEREHFTTNGWIRPGSAYNSAFELLMTARWSDTDQLYREIVSQLANGRLVHRRTIDNPADGGYRNSVSFTGGILESLRRVGDAVARNEEVKGMSQDYVYDGRVYRLEISDVDRDRDRGREWASRGFVDSAHGVHRVRYRSRRESGKRVDFSLWVDLGVEVPLPLAFELRSRSYLRVKAERIAAPLPGLTRIR